MNKQSVGFGTQNNKIAELFEDDMYLELYNARCHDTGEQNSCKWSTIQGLGILSEIPTPCDRTFKDQSDILII